MRAGERSAAVALALHACCLAAARVIRSDAALALARDASQHLSTTNVHALAMVHGMCVAGITSHACTTNGSARVPILARLHSLSAALR